MVTQRTVTAAGNRSAVPLAGAVMASVAVGENIENSAEDQLLSTSLRSTMFTYYYALFGGIKYVFKLRNLMSVTLEAA